ncbi:MAG: DUF4428 domain-containing protein [Clostridiales bacterium]|nr:DUF4428 domain-containing protein [Clostridiales bacterium]MBS5878202.1 DUF4428 domain-containing protein [Clostridiales bacterium]MDU0939525.1 DUF4428 domain-containing protein [Clostridiales bacterium]MDU1041375.1 DUF4428 domain-containing protein [Clostridiales bacterium]MDU3490512.1 DUF4428 domain-containing protein [Clostridiales bacterium]
MSNLLRTEDCPLCKQPTGAFSKTTIVYDHALICRNCFKKLRKAGLDAYKLKNYDIKEIKAAISEKK